MFLDYFALAVLLILAAAAVAIWVILGIMPGRIAKQRNHPHADAKSGSILQTILRSYLVQSVNMNSVGVQPADVVIEPDVTTVDLSAFSRTSELAPIGEEAALEVVPKIKSLLAQVDGQLFSDH